MKLKWDWRGEDKFYASVLKFERRITERSGEFVKFAAEWLVSDIRTHWSMKSPSTAGHPPAVDTGNLDSSVKADGTGRTGGRFASTPDATRWYVRIDTANGADPQGRGGYSQALEKGATLNNGSTLLPRPFMKPAVERLKAVYPDLAKRIIK